MSEAANEASAARPQRPLSSGGQARRNRMRLSCGECRAKKLGCDRNLPCQRCVRSGRPELCSFGAGTRQPLRAASTTTPDHSQADHNTALIQELRVEVAELRALVLSNPSLAETATPLLRDAGTADSGQTLLPDELDEEQSPAAPVHGDSGNAELLDLKDRCPPGYYSQHTLFRSFDEIPQLFPFIKEAADECFRPRGVSLKKIKATCTTYTGGPDAATLEALLPPQDATDALVAFYLAHLEHVHRIVHVPSFKSLYASFWPAPGSPGRPPHPALTVLVLCMLSIAAVCAPDTSPAHRASAPKWAHAADAWISQRGAKAKCRKQLVYFQIACLVYLAKRANAMRKKRFWNQTGALVQDAVLHRLHCGPPKTDAPYLREMKRRVWAALRELDLQNAFEYGLPTLLHSLDGGGPAPAPAPANLDDDEFGQASETLPEPMPDGNYTRASYQALSARSWALRLDISRRLFAGAAGVALPYDEVLRYTREVTQALDALPTWPAASSSSTDETKPTSDNNMPLLVSALLQFQLKEALLALHRPHLARGSRSRRSGFSSLSEVLCYHTARDVLVLNVRLAEAGVQALALVREDLLVAALALVRIGVGQPGPVAGPSNNTNLTLAAMNAASTVALLEQCLPLTEDRYLRCLFGEPWGPLTMCGALVLLKVHLGSLTRPAAKAYCAQRFLDLHYRHFARQQEQQVPPDAVVLVSASLDGGVEAAPAGANQLTTPSSASVYAPADRWLESWYPDLDVDSLDIDMDWDGAGWELPLWYSPDGDHRLGQANVYP